MVRPTLFRADVWVFFLLRIRSNDILYGAAADRMLDKNLLIDGTWPRTDTV